MQTANPYFETFIKAYAALDERSRLLNGDQILCPASDDYGYQSTPKNALTFGAMGVDGVHYAILKLNGIVRDDSPVVHVSPMDSEDVTVLAGSFLHYLADGCAVSTKEMQAVFEAEFAGKNALIGFLSKHFDGIRLLEEDRTAKLGTAFGHLVERKETP